MDAQPERTAREHQHDAEGARQPVVDLRHRQRTENGEPHDGARDRSEGQASHRRPVHLAAQRVEAAPEELHDTRDEHVGADRNRRRHARDQDQRRRQQRAAAGGRGSDQQADHEADQGGRDLGHAETLAPRGALPFVALAVPFTICVPFIRSIVRRGHKKSPKGVAPRAFSLSRVV